MLTIGDAASSLGNMAMGSTLISALEAVEKAILSTLLEDLGDIAVGTTGDMEVLLVSMGGYI